MQISPDARSSENAVEIEKPKWLRLAHSAMNTDTQRHTHTCMYIAKYLSKCVLAARSMIQLSLAIMNVCMNVSEMGKKISLIGFSLGYYKLLLQVCYR